MSLWAVTNLEAVMVLSRIRSLFGFSIFAVIGAAILALGSPVLAFVREVAEIAFPAAAPRERIETSPHPVQVIGLPSLRAFRDSVLSRLGDGRERSPLSVAFVT